MPDALCRVASPRLCAKWLFGALTGILARAKWLNGALTGILTDRHSRARQVAQWRTDRHFRAKASRGPARKILPAIL